MAEKYIVEFRCKNCKAHHWLSIDKGISVEEHLERNKIKCDRCNCVLE